MAIQISNISKSFGKEIVLENISLDAHSGEILCLLGPSGAGKTTLIRLIIGAIKSDSGTITVEGEIMPNMASIKYIGYMPQSDAVYNDISGYDNLSFFGSLHGLKNKQLTQRVEEILDLTNLTKDKDKRVSNYSGGMKKRLSLGIALLHDPEILILDEPTVGIDPVLRKTIWDEFDALCKVGKTIIISTHVMEEAEKCQKAALLYGGHLITMDTVESLKAKTNTGNLEELFFKAQKEGESNESSDNTDC